MSESAPSPSPDPDSLRPNPPPGDPDTTIRASEGATESDPPPAADLTPEEQLARYEESLKNDDWGHQPC